MIDSCYAKSQTQKSFIIVYDETLEAMVVKVLDANRLFPLYIKDEAGLYKINKNRTGKLQMCK